MMKKKKSAFGPLLLLLVLTATTRNTYANPTSNLENSAADLEANVLEIPLIKNIVRVADHLKNGVEYFKTMLRHTYYDIIITQLENDIANLPSDLNNDKQNMLHKLYRANTRIITTRVTLEQAARQLDSYCQELIYIYENNDPDMRVLKYTAKKFNKYANIVMKLLKNALATYKETQDILSEARASLKVFEYKLDAKKKELKSRRSKRDVGVRNKREIGTVLFIAFLPAIAYVTTMMAFGIPRLVENEKINRFIGRIETVESRLEELLNENNKIQIYVSEEIELIIVWEVKLNASIEDHNDLTEDEIFFSIKFIKNRLIELQNACQNYINHDLPDVLQKIGEKKKRETNNDE